jgi:colicin import membrane protein
MTGTTGGHASAPTSEGSVSFSLKELMRLEDERVASVREDARKRREELERAADEEARRIEAAAQARARQEEERLREHERTMQEEAARLDGMKRAIVERERVAAEQAAREAEVARLRAHELELARLRREGGSTSKAAWSVAAASVVALTLGVIAYAAVLRPDADRRLAAARADAAAQGEIVGQTQKQLAELGKRVEALGAQLRTEGDRAHDLELQLADAQRKLADRRVGGPSSQPLHPVAPVPPRNTPFLDGTCKNPGDPLCLGK